MTVRLLKLFSALGFAALSVAAQAQFAHPGLLHRQYQLNAFKTAANNSALTDMAAYYQVITSDPRSASTANPTPYANVVSGTPSRDALLNDAASAYLNALRWVKTGHRVHADASIRALNGWANTFQSISASGTGSAFQHNLDSSWALPMWLNAAEIIRYHNSGSAGWASADITKFNNNFVNVLYNRAKRTLDESTSGGGNKYTSNWAASAALSAMSVGVFQNNVTIYNLGLFHIKRLMPLLILEDGNYSITTDEGGVVNGFQRDGTVREMISREDCGHPQYTLRAFVQAATIAANQGDYSLLLMTNSTAQGSRPLLLRGLEYMSDSRTGAEPTYRTCGGATLDGAGHLSFKFYSLLGQSTPKMQTFVSQVGAEGQDLHFIGWSSATSYANTLFDNNAYCARGILSRDGLSCCPAACGACGGSNCGSRPGGAAACCTSNIQSAGKSCASFEAPCAIKSPF